MKLFHVRDGSASNSEIRAPAALEPRRRRLELLPNCSLTPAAARLFFGSIAFVSLTIAASFVASGFWPVLPFAGLELCLLGWALRVSLRRRHHTQSIDVSDRDVRVVTRGPNGEQEILFSRHWAKVTLRGSDGWYPSRLLIESHGRYCEIGEFLTDEERRALAQRLGTLVGRTSEAPALHSDA